MAAVRQCGRAIWLAILKVGPWGVSLVVAGWYLCISFVSSCMKLVVGECLVCCVYSHLYLSGDSSVGEDAAPDGRCTPILPVVSLFQVVLGGYVWGVWGWSWEGVPIWVAFGEFYVAVCGYVLSGEAWWGDGGWWVCFVFIFAYGGLWCVGQEMG